MKKTYAEKMAKDFSDEFESRYDIFHDDGVAWIPQKRIVALIKNIADITRSKPINEKWEDKEYPDAL